MIRSPVPGEGGIVVTAIGRACTYCGEPTTDPAVVWLGAEGTTIVLHASCVGPLFIRCGRDAHEIQNPAYHARRARRQA